MELIRKYILRDWKLKGLSLILAVMLWFAVSHVGESKMSVSVRVLPQNLAKDFMIVNIDADDVLVTINGPVSILKNLRPRDVKVRADLADAKAGRYTINIRKADIVVPKGVRVETVKPENLVVEIERAIEKHLKVVVKLNPKWVGTYRVKSWYPRYVVVEGSKQSLEKKDSVDTVPVDGDFMAGEEEQDVTLDTKDMLVRKLRPESVRVILTKN
ncbi:MAG: YbbR-like protein [Syntrophorhabdus sp. PtaU1.Bin153]|nr:MAG: YbbR-like protein [Syntrophorhabdus sp. PtaU1.Bin153]